VFLQLNLAKGNVNPDSVTITAQGVTTLLTVTDDGDGNLTGDGDGTIDYVTGTGKLGTATYFFFPLPPHSAANSCLTSPHHPAMLELIPRVARIVISGTEHHVTHRGNNRQDVFFTDDDRRAYLALLTRVSLQPSATAPAPVGPSQPIAL